MKKILLNDIIERLDLKLNNMTHDLIFDTNLIAIDSRQIKSQSIFMPIVGDRFDGHEFIVESFQKGAQFSFCSIDYFMKYRELLKDLPLILVEDTLNALQELAKYIIEESNAIVIAVTGSTGKTTSKDFVFQVLSQKFNTVKTKGNFNNHIGMPLTILNSDEDTQVFVLEMGMNHFGEIDRLVEIAKPDIAIITNIGSSHIENFGSREGILKAKMEIVNYFTKDNILILNGEDTLLRKSYNENSDYRKIDYGYDNEVDFQITNVESDTNYCHNYMIDNIKIELSIPGKHNVLNSANGVIAGKLLGIDDQLIQKAICAYSGEKMRLSLEMSPKGYLIINDAYNASPDSMKSSLEMIDNIVGKRKVVFLGDMFEMGEFAIDGHRQVAEYINLDNVDLCITIGSMAKHIGIRLIERGFDEKKVRHIHNFDQAASLLNDFLKSGDVLLIKGSRGMAMETILNKI
ncbi:MAG: UDP-N-acetylmuramoyl-tripeptide--D-alanyl-D-alanine ligase [Clostridiales bacterium]|nr:UDP-N-acetylmuramoyl-tripeptide--D-alanyl-D-alanine ligase [Clostridiales bacterium]